MPFAILFGMAVDYVITVVEALIIYEVKNDCFKILSLMKGRLKYGKIT